MADIPGRSAWPMWWGPLCDRCTPVPSFLRLDSGVLRRRSRAMSVRPLIIDTDPGIDDALALAMAFNAPGFFVPLITTVAGNTTLDQATRNAALLLPLFGAGHDTVLATGASKPLRRKRVTAEDFHGPDGLGGARDMLEKAFTPVKARRGAVSRLVAAAREYGRDLTLVALRPLTNIALAARKDPAAMRGIGRLVIMGGALRVPGNTTPAAEFNFFADPHAAAEVFGAGLPTTLVPLDVTEQVRLNDQALRAALGRRRDRPDIIGRAVHRRL